MIISVFDREKTLWDKEKMLVTSIFSFSHHVLKRLLSQTRQKVSLCGNGLKVGLCGKELNLYRLYQFPVCVFFYEAFCMVNDKIRLKEIKWINSEILTVAHLGNR